MHTAFLLFFNQVIAKAFHSTESALLRILNDLLLSTDAGDSVILMLLDLTAAINTADHTILISHLEHCEDIGDTALEWFRSYLSKRCFSIKFGSYSSSLVPLHCGVPQGSILGPILFSLYLLPLGLIFKRHGISCHFYADDSQIYLPLNRNDHSSLIPVLKCLKDIKALLAQNFLNLHEGKPEVMVYMLLCQPI